jgi:hypothetical protein
MSYSVQIYPPLPADYVEGDEWDPMPLGQGSIDTVEYDVDVALINEGALCHISGRIGGSDCRYELVANADGNEISCTMCSADSLPDGDYLFAVSAI